MAEISKVSASVLYKSLIFVNKIIFHLIFLNEIDVEKGEENESLTDMIAVRYARYCFIL